MRMPELFQETRFLQKAFVFLFGSQVSMQHFDGNHRSIRENQVLPLIHTAKPTARQCFDDPITAYLFANQVVFVSHIFHLERGMCYPFTSARERFVWIWLRL